MDPCLEYTSLFYFSFVHVHDMVAIVFPSEAVFDPVILVFSYLWKFFLYNVNRPLKNAIQDIRALRSSLRLPVCAFFLSPFEVPAPIDLHANLS